MKIDDITEALAEGADSAALHRANANIRVANELYSGAIKKLQELLAYHKEISAEEGVAVNGIELAEDLEAFIANEVEYAANKRKGN
jgi:hypothetical protein